ncbi:Hypothetical Protein RRSL_04605 [Ralstonia solanacearum UW551]|uniref:Uncharacterized protein n=1 Tax=Ralstonia solanacearum (strain UW551) TaxID=342110 RepID=A0AB33VIV5_RALSU|nr:Hypothetical Protein RRSL_04605 [Ralstonia solanacearum UW551]
MAAACALRRDRIARFKRLKPVRRRPWRRARCVSAQTGPPPGRCLGAQPRLSAAAPMRCAVNSQSTTNDASAMAISTAIRGLPARIPHLSCGCAATQLTLGSLA